MCCWILSNFVMNWNFSVFYLHGHLLSSLFVLHSPLISFRSTYSNCIYSSMKKESHIKIVILIVVPRLFLIKTNQTLRIQVRFCLGQKFWKVQYIQITMIHQGPKLKIMIWLLCKIKLCRLRSW